jgi:hypothetical protein
MSVPWLCDNLFGSGTSQVSVGDIYGRFVVEEERIETRSAEELEVGL